MLDSPCFCSYLLKTQRTISLYNWVLFVGKTPSKSSKITHSKAVFKGFFVNSRSSSAFSESTDEHSFGHTISKSFLANCSLLMFLKY